MSDTERVTPPDQLRRTRDQLQVILDGVGEAITAQAPTGELIFANATAAALLGFATPEDLLAAKLGDVMARYRVLDEAGNEVASDALPSRAALRGETPAEALLRFRVVASGEERWSLVRARPVFDGEGKLQSVINIIRDVTESKRAENVIRVSQEWFATTLKSIGDAVIATDAVGRITFMNDVAESLTGWTRADANGEPLARVFHIVNEQTRLEVESPVTKVLREGVVVGLANHTILIRRGGSEIAIDDSGAPIRDASGALVGVVLVFRDVTEKRREEERRVFLGEVSAVLASSLDYATTLRTVAELAVPRVADWCTVDIREDDGAIRALASAHVNPAKVRWMHDLRRKYPPEPSDTFGVARVLRTGLSEMNASIPQSDLRAWARDEAELDLWNRIGMRARMIVPLRARGRTLGAVVLAFSESSRTLDADDLALAEQLGHAAALAVDNARLYAEAQNASRLKDEFLATLSHELRTPLNAVLGWARMLRTGPRDEERLERALLVIERNAREQSRLIDDLLDVSRIITGKMVLDVRAVALDAVVDAALEGVRPSADAKGIRIDVRIDRLLGPYEGDAGRLQQVVWNLLSNAVKFTPKGGHVSVELARTGSQIDLAVRDSGQGIDAAFLPHVFDRFRQGEASVTRTHTGLGLGLSIVKDLVELHGGAVRAESDGRGKGARFVVSLPVALSRAEESLPSVALPALPRLDGVRAVVVDDQPDNREIMSLALEDAGALVVAVASAADALVELRARVPDILVSDIGMPGQDGYELIRRVRMLPAEGGGAVPAIAVTAHARDADRNEAILAGYQAHLAKPIDPGELVVAVARFAIKRHHD